MKLTKIWTILCSVTLITLAGVVYNINTLVTIITSVMEMPTSVFPLTLSKGKYLTITFSLANRYGNGMKVMEGYLLSILSLL